MEVKIGVQRTPREIVLESTLNPDQVEAAVRDALALLIVGGSGLQGVAALLKRLTAEHSRRMQAMGLSG